VDYNKQTIWLWLTHGTNNSPFWLNPYCSEGKTGGYTPHSQATALAASGHNPKQHTAAEARRRRGGRRDAWGRGSPSGSPRGLGVFSALKYAIEVRDQAGEREQGLRQDDGGVYRVLGGLSGGGEITGGRPQVESKLPLSSLKHTRKKGNATGGPPVRWFVVKITYLDKLEPHQP